jgi:nickel-type superoxide dismutase maturation protease
MLPLLKPGDEVLVDPTAYRDSLPHVGDIIIARHPQRPGLKMIKRVDAIIRDELVVLKGDNSSESTDSRIFGPVTREYLVGRVTSRFG